MFWKSPHNLIGKVQSEPAKPGRCMQSLPLWRKHQLYGERTGGRQKVKSMFNIAHFQGNPICQCIPGFIPFPSPIDGCCEPYENPNSRVLTPPQTDPCSPTPCGPGTTCSVQGGNAICRCQDGFSPNPDTITGCKPECQRDPDCRMGFQCRLDFYLDSSDPLSSTCFFGQC